MRTFVCRQKSALDLGPESAHAQRGLGRVINGIGQGVAGYRFESYLFGVWKLPVEGLPLAKVM